MGIRNGYKKSGFVSTSSHRAALAARNTEVWCAPKASLARRVFAGLALAAFVAVWLYVLVLAFS